MIELVVFDMAGTTVHDGDAVNRSFRAALANSGFDADPEFVKTVMGLPKPEAIRRLLRAGGHAFDERLVETIHEDFVQRMRHHYLNDPSVCEIRGAMATFALLRSKGIKIALNSGFSRAVVDTLLTRLEWRIPTVIDACISSDEVARGRPAPDMIQRLMATCGITDAKKVAKVGDTQADLEEGTNAGCGLVIGVTTGSYTREQLLRYPHTHIVDSVVEVPVLLEG